MQVTERFPALGFFEGNRTIVLRGVPVGASIREARFTLTPVSEDGVVGPTIERIEFDGDTGEDPDDENRATGVRKTVVSSAADAWVEVAFSTQRRLHRVSGPDLSDSTLQADLGGTFLGVNTIGALESDPDDAFSPSSDSDAPLPGISAGRIRFTGEDPANDTPNVTSIELQSVPVNVSLAFGNEVPFFTKPGELVFAQASPNVAPLMQLAVDGAEEEGGFAVVPVTVHTDAPARLTVDVTVDYDEVEAPLGEDVPEATLEYGFAGESPGEGDASLTVKVPASSRVRPGSATARLQGSFDGTTIVGGELLQPDAVEAMAIDAGGAVAQAFRLATDATVSSVDLLLSTDDLAFRLQVDVREDLDGKPAAESLLATPVAVDLEGASASAPTWVNVALPADFQSQLPPAADPASPPTLWLVGQSALGAGRWHAAADRQADNALPALKVSRDEGLSWRDGTLAGGKPGTPSVAYRLRHTATKFEVPVEVQVGDDDTGERVTLEQFNALGRVDFALNPAAFSNSLNRTVEAARADDCPAGERLVNGGFTDRNVEVSPYLPAAWTGDEVSVENYSTAHMAVESVAMLILGVINEGDPEPRSISQVLPAAGGCDYELTFHGYAADDQSRVELIWRTGECGVDRVDTLVPWFNATKLAAILDDFNLSRVFLSRFDRSLNSIPVTQLRVEAPSTAEQVEVRLIARQGSVMEFDRVSLVATPRGLVNPTLLHFDDVRLEAPEEDRELRPDVIYTLAGWSLANEGAEIGRDLDVDVVEGFAALGHGGTSTEELVLTQFFPATPSAVFRVEFTGTVEAAEARLPRITLEWVDQSGAVVGDVVVISLPLDGARERLGRGTVPAQATEGRLSIVIPPGALLIVESIELEQLPLTDVPVRLLSASPGRLTLQNFQVAFEESPPLPAELADDPCRTTPADQAPGDVCECDPCGKPSTTPDSLPPPVAVPADPFTGIPGTAIGGLAMRANLSRALLARPRSRRVTERAVVPPLLAVEALPPLQEVDGIGPVREEALLAAGITNLRQLSQMSPAAVARRVGLPVGIAENLVEGAREVLTSDGPLTGRLRGNSIERERD